MTLRRGRSTVIHSDSDGDLSTLTVTTTSSGGTDFIVNDSDDLEYDSESSKEDDTGRSVAEEAEFAMYYTRATSVRDSPVDERSCEVLLSRDYPKRSRPRAHAICFDSIRQKFAAKRQKNRSNARSERTRNHRIESDESEVDTPGGLHNPQNAIIREDRYECVEQIDLDELRRLIARDEARYKKLAPKQSKSAEERKVHTDYVKLVKLQEQLGDGSENKVIFTERSGRLYPKRGMVSLQTLPRRYRKPLCYKFDTDVDIVNCQPVLLCQILEREEISAPLLRGYVTNRDHFLKDAPKQTWLRLMNLGRPIPNTSDLQKKFSSEIHSAVTKLLSKPKFAKEKRRGEDQARSKIQTAKFEGKQKPFYNPMGSALSFLLSNEERRCVLCAIRAFIERGYVVGTIIHDGFHVRSRNVKSDDLLYAAERIRKDTGFRILLKKKPLDDFE